MLDYLKKEWELAKLEIITAKSEEEKHHFLKEAKRVHDTAMEVYGVDLYKELGGGESIFEKSSAAEDYYDEMEM